jgi:hypothetical protein
LGDPFSSAAIAVGQNRTLRVVKKSNKVVLFLTCEMAVAGVSTGAFITVAEADGYKAAPI